MNTNLRFLKNTIYLSITDIIKPFISIILIIYISRTLGTMGLGEYTAITTFTFFFEIFAMLGMHHLIVRDIAVDNSNCETYFVTSFIIGFVSSLIALLALFLMLKAASLPSNISSGIKVLGFSIIFVVLADYWDAILEGLQRMELKSFVSTMDVVIRVVLGISTIYLGFGMPGLIWTLVAGRILICLLSLFILLRLGIKLKLKLSIRLCFSLFKQTTTFLFISIVTTAYWRIDILILSKMKGAIDTGYYSAAYRFMEVLKGLSYGYIAALFPIIASAFATSKDSFKRRCVLSVKYLFILTFPISIGTTILSKNIILLAYGTEFLNSIIVMQILIWTICFFPIALVFARALVASKNQRFDLLCNVLALVFNISLNLLLIPRFGYIGSAMATLISICFFMFIQIYFVTKILFRIELLNILIKPFLAACTMGIFTLLLRNMYIFFVVALSAGFYIFLLIKIKTFSMEEIAMFKGLWRQKALLFKIHGS